MMIPGRQVVHEKWQKKRSPVETGDLNDCLPYEKTLRVGSLGDCSSSAEDRVATRCLQSQCNNTLAKCGTQANFVAVA
jgi:hypothetical protein